MPRTEPLIGVELLQTIGGRARPAGSESERHARELCARELSDAGFSVLDRPFEYSAFPGLWGTPLVGIMLLGAGLVVALGPLGATTGSRFAMVAGPIIGLMMALTAGLIGWWLARYGVGNMRVVRRRGVNLEASRGVPNVWLVAHLDTKSQPVSLLVRAAGVLITCVSWSMVLVASVAILAGIAGRAAVAPLGWLAVVGAIPLVLSWVSHRGDGAGALDNASGVAALIEASVLVDRDLPLGVLLSSGEELGLAGARAWLAGRRGRGLGQGVVINCDGIDDVGEVTCTVARDGGVFRLSVGEVVRDAPRLPAVRVRSSLPGVLFDAVAFADEGWPAATVSRGTLGSLARVHTRADTLGRLRGAGVEQTARFIAALAGSIIAGQYAAGRYTAAQYAGDAGAEDHKRDGSTRD